MFLARTETPAMSDAGRLFVKLSAFALMVLDHVDWFLWGGALGLNGTLGRVVAPAFVVVLALGLQHVTTADHQARLLLRLLAAGAVAQVPYALLQGAWWPLNIMWTLALGVVLVVLWERGHLFGALVVGVLASTVVDYGWLGAGALWVSYGLLRARVPLVCVAAVAGAAFSVWNGSLWALLAVPLVWAGEVMPGRAPRLKWFFYVGYPVHLMVLAGWEWLS